MKKNIIIAALAAATALFVSTSCTKQDVDLPAVSGAGVFTASIAQVQTKTSLGTYEGYDNVLFWDKRDSILINKETFYSAEPDSERPGRAEFLHCGGPEPKAPYEAIFPASLYVDNNYMQGYCFPQVQEYRAGKFNAPMYAYDEIKQLLFNNICGVIRFSLKGTEKIQSIELTSKEKYINGAFKVVKEGEYDYKAEIDNTAGDFYDYNRTVTLSCGNGVQLSKEDSTDFFIYLPETSFAAGDLSVRVITADGKSFEKTASNPVNVKKNTVYTFNWEVDATLLHTLATFFRGLSEDQARLAAATDEAMSVALIEQYKNNPQKLFLPEIHTWSNARPAILAIEESLAKIDNNVVNLMGLTRPELMFLEAYLYFELARTYGQAPIMTLENPNPGSASLNELMNFIVKNAKEASDILPEKYDPDKKTIELAEGIEMTRPTKWAAKALAGRTCLYASSLLFNLTSFKSMATVLFKDIIDADDDSGDIFGLEQQYSDLWGDKAFDNKELIFGVRLAQNDAYKGIHPTLWLFNQFENDLRKDCTFGNDESGLILTKPVSQIIPVFRYADILLMYSESDENVDGLNEVRKRCDLNQISYSLPDIIEGRMKELAFEGHRFWDVRRWKEGSTYFGTNLSLPWSEDYNFYPTPW